MCEMADVDATIDALNNIDILTVIDSNDWVKVVWDADFIDVPERPPEIEQLLKESVHLGSCLSRLHDALKPWAEGLEAASGEGSSAFNIFYEEIFNKSLKMLTSLNPGPSQITVKTTKMNKNSKKKPTKMQQKSQEADTFSDEGDEEDVEDDDNGLCLTPQEIVRLSRAQVGILQDFVRLVRTYQLNESSLTRTTQLLVQLAVTDTPPPCFTLEQLLQDDIGSDIDDIDNVPELSFKALAVVCAAKHARSRDVLNSVLKLLMPSLVMQHNVGGQSGKPKTSSIAAQFAPQASQIVIRDYVVNFIRRLVREKLEGVDLGLRLLLQRMCIKISDKGEYRTKIAQAIIVLLREQTSAEYAQFIHWVVKYSKTSKITCRIFALDLISLFIDEPERTNVDVSTLSPELIDCLSRSCLVKVIIERCSDVAPSVRTRAIALFAQCTSSTNPCITGIVRSMVTPRSIGMQHPEDGPCFVRTPVQTGASGTGPIGQGVGDCTVKQKDTLLEMDTIEGVDVSSRNRQSADSLLLSAPHLVTPRVNITLEDASGVISMLRRRSEDDKINVRRVALQALECIIRLEGNATSTENLRILEERCRDGGLSVRKQAVQSLNELLRDMPLDRNIQRAWLRGVLPLVLDTEASVQSKCLELLEETIFQNIASHLESKSSQQRMVWNLLDIIAASNSDDLRGFLQKACHHWGTQGSIPRSIVNSIKSHIGTENNSGAWLILSEVAQYVPKFNPDFVLDYWSAYARNAPESEENTVLRVLSTLNRLTLTPEASSGIIADLKRRLMDFRSSPKLISAFASTLSKVADSVTDEWFGDILIACDNYLSNVILNERNSAQDGDDGFDEEMLIRHLFTLGEINQLCPRRTPKRVYWLVKSLIATPSTLQPPPITDMVYSSQESSSSQISSQPPSSQFLISQFHGSSKMSLRVKSFAFLALGKLCLQNESMAKSCVPALARELEVSTDESIRNNIVVILCDLCIRYTSLLDRYVGCISACVLDTSVLVRHQTLTNLTHLLQEDYIKWKGPLFFRFAFSLIDDDAGIRTFGEFCLTHLLVKRCPALYFHNFLESIFYFNSFEHASYNRFIETERERKLFSLAGAANTEKRMLLYKFMLENMNDDHRFQVLKKLTHEILGSVVDEGLLLNAESAVILQDTLRCLASKEIKLSALRAKPNEEFAETEQEMVAVVVQAAKKTIISQVMKKTMIETTIPIMISLKHMLEKQQSPVMREYMTYLRELMKDYKTEVKDILAMDKQLVTEIEFDLRQFEANGDNWTQKGIDNMQKPLDGHHQTPTLPTSSGSATPNLRSGVTTPVAAMNSATSSSDIPVLAPHIAAATPNIRRVSLATIAVINSARRAIERAALAKLQPIPVPNGEKTTNRSEATKKSLTSEKGQKTGSEEVECDNANENLPTADKVDDGGRGAQSCDQRKAMERKAINQKTIRSNDQILRASSTPAGATKGGRFANLTFAQGDDNLSVIAASPAMQGIMSPTTNSMTSSPVCLRRTPASASFTTEARDLSRRISHEMLADDDIDVDAPKTVILMPPLNKLVPKPPVWNVKSPEPVPVTRRRIRDANAATDDDTDKNSAGGGVTAAKSKTAGGNARGGTAEIRRIQPVLRRSRRNITADNNNLTPDTSVATNNSLADIISNPKADHMATTPTSSRIVARSKINTGGMREKLGEREERQKQAGSTGHQQQGEEPQLQGESVGMRNNQEGNVKDQQRQGENGEKQDKQSSHLQISCDSSTSSLRRSSRFLVPETPIHARVPASTDRGVGEGKKGSGGRGIETQIQVCGGDSTQSDRNVREGRKGSGGRVKTPVESRVPENDIRWRKESNGKELMSAGKTIEEDAEDGRTASMALRTRNRHSKEPRLADDFLW